jgi:hypothetical protein
MFKPIEVDSQLGFLVIEMNPRLIILNSANEVFDTLSHELAHCLDFVIRGYYGKNERTFHDEFWSFLHKRMGGNGHRYLMKTTPIDTLRTVNKNVTFQRFRGLDIKKNSLQYLQRNTQC